MNRTIIVEGVDRVGKGTLLAGLGLPVSKMRAPRNQYEGLGMYANHFSELSAARRPVAWDRGHLSELVYARLYRQVSGVYLGQVERMARAVRVQVPVTLVYLYPLFPDLMLEDERKNANLSEELRGFERALSRRPWPSGWRLQEVCVHRVDGGWRTPEEILEVVLEGDRS